jgi:hypothetical protein
MIRDVNPSSAALSADGPVLKSPDEAKVLPEFLYSGKTVT